MRERINRRDLIRGAVTTGAVLALPGIARADKADSEFKRLFESLAQSAPLTDEPARTSDARRVVNGDPYSHDAYSHKVIAIARRELGRAGQQIVQRDVVAVADFARPSSLPRFHLVDLSAGSLRSYLVAHGRGSDPEHDGWLKSFSNVVNSEATSRGAYIVAEGFAGKYGPSLRLQGLDADNCNAYDRAIVMHPAWYAAPDMVAKWGKLGRSEGCFAIDPEYFSQVLAMLTGGGLLFADRIEDV